MAGKWCLELGELANLHGRAIEIVKSIITRTTDTYRASFGRAPGDYPRQCVFAGTVDRDDWNADEAGGTRWWPAHCPGDINLEWLAENRAQLFAEARERVESGEPWHNVDPRDAAVEQAARRPRERWLPLIQRYLLGQTETTLESVMRGPLEFDKAKDWKGADLRRAVIALKQLGWSEQGERWVAPPSVVGKQLTELRDQAGT
jgi:predicted P-loop ATPase